MTFICKCQVTFWQLHHDLIQSWVSPGSIGSAAAQPEVQAIVVLVKTIEGFKKTKQASKNSTAVKVLQTHIVSLSHCELHSKLGLANYNWGFSTF